MTHIQWKIACEFHKIEGVMHTVVVAGGTSESCTRLKPQAVFEWDMERTHRRTERAAERQERTKVTNIALFKALGVRSVICLIESPRSRFARVCLPLQRETHF